MSLKSSFCPKNQVVISVELDTGSHTQWIFLCVQVFIHIVLLIPPYVTLCMICVCKWEYLSVHLCLCEYVPVCLSSYLSVCLHAYLWERERESCERQRQRYNMCVFLCSPKAWRSWPQKQYRMMWRFKMMRRLMHLLWVQFKHPCKAVFLYVISPSCTYLKNDLLFLFFFFFLK